MQGDLVLDNQQNCQHAIASRDGTSKKDTRRLLGGLKASFKACLKTNTKNLTLQSSCLHRWLCVMHVRKLEDVIQLLEVPVRLLDSSSGWGGLASCLGGQLLPWGLASCWLASCLLCTSHDSFVCFGTLCGFLRFVVWCASKVVWCWIWSAEPNSGAINLIVPHMPDVRIGKPDDKCPSKNGLSTPYGQDKRTIREFCTPKYYDHLQTSNHKLHKAQSIAAFENLPVKRFTDLRRQATCLDAAREERD